MAAMTISPFSTNSVTDGHATEGGSHTNCTGKVLMALDWWDTQRSFTCLYTTPAEMLPQLTPSLIPLNVALTPDVSVITTASPPSVQSEALKERLKSADAVWLTHVMYFALASQLISPVEYELATPTSHQAAITHSRQFAKQRSYCRYCDSDSK